MAITFFFMLRIHRKMTRKSGISILLYYFHSLLRRTHFFTERLRRLLPNTDNLLKYPQIRFIHVYSILDIFFQYIKIIRFVLYKYPQHVAIINAQLKYDVNIFCHFENDSVLC